jgi:hypothetical protein
MLGIMFSGQDDGLSVCTQSDVQLPIFQGCPARPSHLLSMFSSIFTVYAPYVYSPAIQRYQVPAHSYAAGHTYGMPPHA